MDREGLSKRQLRRARYRANRAQRALEASVVIEDNERAEPTHVLALDCEFVGAGPDGCVDLLARVSIVNEHGDVVYDEFVAPTERVTDYRTAVSGVRPRDLRYAIPFHEARMDVCKLIKKRIVVGHSVYNDFRVLQLCHDAKRTRDTATCSILKKMANHQHGSPSLKILAKKVLGIDIQRGEHDSITDARVALELYDAVKEQWER